VKRRREDMAYPMQYEEEPLTWEDIVRAVFAFIVLMLIIAFGVMIASFGGTL
jgi:hypothetical protein